MNKVRIPIILILTSFGEDNKVFPAIRKGARGYLLKDIHPDDLVKALRPVNQGQVQLHPDIAKKLMDSVSAPDQSNSTHPRDKNIKHEIDLTEREKEVLRCIARGLNNREIASDLAGVGFVAFMPEALLAGVSPGLAVILIAVTVAGVFGASLFVAWRM